MLFYRLFINTTWVAEAGRTGGAQEPQAAGWKHPVHFCHCAEAEMNR